MRSLESKFTRGKRFMQNGFRQGWPEQGSPKGTRKKNDDAKLRVAAALGLDR
jgi:hypothetical protein